MAARNIGEVRAAFADAEVSGAFAAGFADAYFGQAFGVLPKAEIDLLWFGIFIVLVVEMAQITPPVGFNLFVIQGLTGRNILYISRAALPFFGVLLLMTILVVMVPGIVTALPHQMLGH